MKKNTKILIGIVVGGGLISCLACVAMMSLGFFSAFDAANDPALQEEATKVGEAGAPRDCERAALDRARTCGQIDFSCQTKVQMFASTCLYATKQDSPGFCDRLGLDPNEDMMQQSFKAGMWSAAECKKIMPNNQACTNALNASVNYCVQQASRGR